MIKVKNGKVKIVSDNMTELLMDVLCVIAGAKDTIMDESELCRGEVENIIKAAVDAGIYVGKGKIKD